MIGPGSDKKFEFCPKRLDYLHKVGTSKKFNVQFAIQAITLLDSSKANIEEKSLPQLRKNLYKDHKCSMALTLPVDKGPTELLPRVDHHARTKSVSLHSAHLDQEKLNQQKHQANTNKGLHCQLCKKATIKRKKIVNKGSRILQLHFYLVAHLIVQCCQHHLSYISNREQTISNSFLIMGPPRYPFIVSRLVGCFCPILGQMSQILLIM